MLKYLKMDNFEEFINAYIDNIVKVSSKTMMITMGEIDNDLIYSNICWMVTDNMIQLLAQNPKVFHKISNNIMNLLYKELLNNKLVIMGQDLDDQDHWFALIGDHEYVHIVEHLPTKCNYYKTFKLYEFLLYFEQILEGDIPDRFYNTTYKHQYIILSFDRKVMNKKLVTDYIK